MRQGQTPSTGSPQRTSLYRHFDSEGVLLYVGISCNAVNRLTQHKNSSHWYYDIAYITVQHFDSREEAEKAEREAIQDEKPEHNIRLADDQRKVPISARVSVDLVAWLDKQAGSRSSVIEEALCYFKRMR